MIHQFLEEWAAYEPGKAPFLFPGDKAVPSGDALECCAVIHESWQQYLDDPEFGAFNDPRLHLGLLPIPFLGNLATASAVVLMLNPGVGHSDYFGEYEIPEYRNAVVRNLLQAQDPTPNFCLDPRFSWHGGFEYWHAKLGQLIDVVAKERGLERASALQLFAREIAVLELMPYHSAVAKFPVPLMQQLRSVQLAKAFAHDVLLPRTREGEVLLVVTRSGKLWDLTEQENVVVYSGGETRAAHLTPQSRGGGAILERLRRSC